ncbi:MAG: ethylbenzene dehydrogenase-related protein [Candidatus Zixiibacteriota bacterium]
MMNKDNRHIGITVSFLAALSLTIFGAVGCEDPGPAGTRIIYDRVEVLSSNTAPPMNDPQSDIWDEAARCFIKYGEVNADYVSEQALDWVEIRAIKAAGRLYLMAEWSDDSYSAYPEFIEHHRDSLYVPISDTSVVIVLDTFTVTDTIDDVITIDTFLLTYLDTSWVQQSRFIRQYTGTNPDDSGVYQDSIISNAGRDQDRIAIIWDMGSNGTEKADCAIMCHDAGDTSILGHRMFTNNAGFVDVWHWQSAKTDPAFLASDEYWSDQGRVSDGILSPIFESNFDTILEQPIYMHPDDATHPTETFVHDRFIHKDEAVPFLSVADGIPWQDGYKIPGFIVDDNASGSVADVSSFSRFTMTLGTEHWTVIMSRELTTGNDDDIEFGAIQPGDSVQVSIAVMDNADRLHAGSKPFYIVFP